MTNAIERTRIRAAMEAESARIDAIEETFPDEAFALLAIVRGWTVEESRKQYAERTEARQ